MKKFLLFIACTILLVPVFAQTNVSGSINSNTIWTVAASPYIVTGDLLLLNGYTLTINPGVVVKFNAQTKLQVNGELIAIGTFSSRIIFTANQVSPVAGDWDEIYFTDSTADAQYDANGNYLSGTTMQYCDILYAGATDSGAVHINYSYPHFSNCTLAYSRRGGIIGTGTAFIVDSCVIKDCNGTGLDMFLAHPRTCDWHMQYDTILNNTGGGVHLLGGNCTGLFMGTISHNYIKNNSVKGGLWLDGFNSDISENVFESNSSSGANVQGTALSIAKNGYLIECNLFLNNYSNAATSTVCITAEDYISNTIAHNTFDGNYNAVSSPYNAILYIQSTIYIDLFVTNNIFKNNSQPGGNICSLRGMSTLNNNSRFIVDSNEYNLNQCNAELRLYSDNVTPGIPYAVVSHNNFLNSSAHYSLYNDASYHGSNLDADSNYWGSTSSQHLDSVIYDFFDDVNLTGVLYNPIFSLPVAKGESCSPGIIEGDNTIYKVSQIPFSIYPNPAHFSFTISLNEHWPQASNANLRIFDLTGRCVYEKEIGNSKLEIRDADMRQGIYFVKVSSGERSVTQKLIIE
jgi:hypothetical protein